MAVLQHQPTQAITTGKDSLPRRNHKLDRRQQLVRAYKLVACEPAAHNLQPAAARLGLDAAQEHPVRAILRAGGVGARDSGRCGGVPPPGYKGARKPAQAKTVRKDRKAIVVCPEGYWKRGNVQAVCAQHGTEIVEAVSY